jgi:hypothetical protein
LSAPVRSEFVAIGVAFDMMPQITTTGAFSTVFNQQGDLTFTLPAGSGTLALESDISGLAPKNAPVFTTSATLSYTLPTLDDSNEAVSSKWVTNFLAASGFVPAGASPVTSVAGRTGIVTLAHTDITDWTAATAAAVAPETTARTAADTAETTARIAGDVVPSPGMLFGLTLSNDVSITNSVIDIAAGFCADSTNAVKITLGAFKKSIAGAWFAGTGGNGMGTGLVAAISTWYNVFAAVISGASDVFLDTSPTAANAPAGTTAFRRLGSIFVGSTGNIAPFIQSGDNFQWIGTPADFSMATLSTVSRTLYTLFVPSGVRTTVTFRAQGNCVPSALAVDFTSPDCSDQAIAVVADLTSNAGTLASGRFSVRTNTASQIGIRALNASSTLSLGTIGWTDARGRT